MYRLIPPRPTFHLDMNGEERATMDQHVEYWGRLVEAGKIVVQGPVVGTPGSSGLGVLVADDESQARSMVESDPAISSTLASFEFRSMPVTVLPD